MTKGTSKAIWVAGLAGLAYVLYQNRAQFANVLPGVVGNQSALNIIQTPGGVSPMAIVTQTGNVIPIGGIRPPISGTTRTPPIVVGGDNPLRFRLA